MKTKILLSFFFVISLAYAQEPIFYPSMAISSFTDTDSPFNEEVDKIIDGNSQTKYLDFIFSDGMGFTVDLGGIARVANSISITTANDAPGRDPMNYEVLGSNDGTDFTSITSGSITCVFTRFLERDFTFTNTTAYLFYRVIYTTQCDTANSLQVSETQLFGEALSIDEHKLKSESVSVTPNPNTGIFTVKLTQINSLNKILITDITGKLVKEILFDNDTSFTEREIDLGTVESGVYVMTLINSRGKLTKKFVVI